MSQRSHSINYSEKIDTSVDCGLSETQEISQLFLNYLKTQSTTESDSLKKSKAYLKQLQNGLIIFTWYEAIAFTSCFIVLIISHEYLLIYIGFGLFFKFLIFLILTISAKKQKKFIGLKSTITRKIFLKIIVKEIIPNPEHRLEIKLIDLKIASKLTFQQIFKEFTKYHINSLIIIILITLGIYAICIQFIIEESKNNQYLIFSEFALISLPLSFILIILSLMLIYICINSFINLIHMIVKIIINICISVPNLIRYILNIFKIKREKHTILMKYIHNSFTSKDLCSICLCSFQNQGILLPCKHLFHIKCIEKWFFANNTCPICRSKINNDDENQQK
ncbi:unnamed protein product [Paramecium sonneborni]|uniref:RING-type domain-containing protein n=1 Tax=Paramecium sonneborni TaxID=65129 RepID=A0A8S1L6J4_9CILI|nr:unnamed protein product [Paramecium sonneborni]